MQYFQYGQMADSNIINHWQKVCASVTEFTLSRNWDDFFSVFKKQIGRFYGIYLQFCDINIQKLLVREISFHQLCHTYNRPCFNISDRETGNQEVRDSIA